MSIRLPIGSVRSLAGEIAPATAPARRAWPRRLLILAGVGAVAILGRAHVGEFVHEMSRVLHVNWHLVVLAAALETGSVTGYVLLLHRMVSRANPRLRLLDSYDMTLAGAAATRLLPTAGLGGVALTVWALRARGVRAKDLAERLIAFLLVLYGVYMAALLASGVAVAIGWVHVSAGQGLGLVGAGVAGGILALVGIAFTAPGRVASVLGRLGEGSGRVGSISRHAAARLPVLGAAAARAWSELRRPHPALLGALAWWAFDIGVLATMLHAFDVRLSLAALVLAYFLGTMFNMLPVPGSLSGGLVASLVALGAPAGAAIAAVLSYRALAVWLPAGPGVVSLVRLRSSVAARREPSKRRGTPAPRSAAPQIAVAA
ncbi:MAG TPA: lysylphosphatidylglycerol synthase domain-containing protein [Solirubrobacteraceae bacterium]|nr:lysylphosphatidylglycerol synthase domain-containing protein [Solirubrobacteraceae bacterium]